jgi:hypothetical protein
LKNNNSNEKAKKSISYYMRSLHRDIGFFVIGLTIVFSLSGITLVYRDLDFMTYETQVEKQLSPNMELPEISKILHARDLKAIKTEGETIYFKNGSYNKSTGMAVYKTKEVYFPFNKFNELHMTMSKNPTHWFVTTYGVLLLFLAVSSLWMFKSGTNSFRRSLYITGAGILLTVIILLI